MLSHLISLGRLLIDSLPKYFGYQSHNPKYFYTIHHNIDENNFLVAFTVHWKFDQGISLFCQPLTCLPSTYNDFFQKSLLHSYPSKTKLILLIWSQWKTENAQFRLPCQKYDYYFKNIYQRDIQTSLRTYPTWQITLERVAIINDNGLYPKYSL